MPGHLWLCLTKVELAGALVLVPAVIRGWIEGWVLWSLELNVTLWSGYFFLGLLWNWNIPHTRCINQRSDLTLGYVSSLSAVVFELTLVLSRCQTLEWRNFLALILRSVYLWQIKIHLQRGKGLDWRCLVVEWLFSCFRPSQRVHGWLHQVMWLLVVEERTLLMMKLRPGCEIIFMGSSVDVIRELFLARCSHDVVFWLLASSNTLVDLPRVDR